MLIEIEKLTIESFLEIFEKIQEIKRKAGIEGIINNPPDLLERAKLYGIQYKNGSWGWASNIWNRSAEGSVVIERDEDLKPEHRELMRSVLEQILCRKLIQVDATIGTPGTPVAMHARLYEDAQFPDIAYRWKELNFPASPEEKPDAIIFHIPHYLENPNVPGRKEMLRVLRFPNHNYTIVTATSYQGEVKKGFLTHWINYVYQKGGTGEHASLKEFTVKRVDGSEKRIAMCVWGLSGSGKSTHGLYIINERTNRIFIEKFGIDMAKYVYNQVIKNDDIVAIFPDRVYGSEKGSWTKTEDVDENQVAMYTAGMSPRALHENTEFDENGNVSFAGKLYQYHGKLNRNARSVFYLEDTGYYDGNVNSTVPLNMAVFISPGYTSDYAWVKINSPEFAAKVLADGRTIGHPAQSRVGVGQEKYESRYCLPFTMGATNAQHVTRFYEFLVARKDEPVEVYLINTTGRVGAEYEWVEREIGDRKILIPTAKFEEKEGKKKPIGGTGPSIEETELFLFQAARGAVKYAPHPIFGEKVLVPVEVEGLTKERLKELDPFTYRTRDEMERLLRAQIELSKYYLSIQCPGLPEKILNAMDF
ncbi:MAG: phosphoenolpyruvate carboxykinase (ATP) [Thermoplasmata archaeon]